MNHPAPAIKAKATYQDVLDAPEELVAELIAGRLHLSPRPASRHARANFKLGSRLDDPYDAGVGGPGGWFFATEPEIHIGDDVAVPDLAGWRRERMGEYPDAAFFTLAPDWVCEILSPSTRRFDLTEKRGLYGQWGVGHLWLLDPREEFLEAFVLGDGNWVLAGAVGGDEAVCLPPFEAVSFPLSSLWT